MPADGPHALQVPLEKLRAVNRVKHSRPADFVATTRRFHIAVNADQVRQVRLLRMPDLLGAQADEEIRQSLKVRVHVCCCRRREQLINSNAGCPTVASAVQ